MPAIRRISDAPYRWNVIDASLSEVANQERLLPADFISADGFGVTAAARRYLAPLIPVADPTAGRCDSNATAAPVCADCSQLPRLPDGRRAV